MHTCRCRRLHAIDLLHTAMHWFKEGIALQKLTSPTASDAHRYCAQGIETGSVFAASLAKSPINDPTWPGHRIATKVLEQTGVGSVAAKSRLPHGRSSNLCLVLHTDENETFALVMIEISTSFSFGTWLTLD